MISAAALGNLVLAVDAIANLSGALGRWGASVKNALAEGRELTDEEYAPIKAANDAVMNAAQAKIDALPTPATKQGKDASALPGSTGVPTPGG